MLRRIETMEGYSIAATDGLIGHVKDFYFDDAAWVVRYLIVETGRGLAHRKVLISPLSVGEPNWNSRTFPVSISQGQVKGSPDIDTDKPVSRQHEESLLRLSRDITCMRRTERLAMSAGSWWMLRLGRFDIWL